MTEEERKIFDTMLHEQSDEDKVMNFYQELELRYIESFSDNPNRVYDDIKEIVEAIVKDDFIEMQSSLSAILTYMESVVGYKSIIKNLRAQAEENYNNCFNFIYGRIDTQIRIIDKYDLNPLPAISIIENHISLWYKKENKLPLKMNFHLFGEKEEPQSITFTYPDTHLQSLTKANHKIFSKNTSLAMLQQVAFDVTPNKNKQTITYSVNVNMNAKELKGTENITEFDESVLNSVISVVETNNHGVFTAKQLATHLLYGDNPNNSNPSPQRVGAVTKSIEKQRFINIKIDWTEHAKLNKTLSEGDIFKTEGYMLPVTSCEIKMNGQQVNAYRLLELPPLYQYAKSVGQLATHPATMLNVPINLDEKKIVIRDFLLSEIGHMKNNKHWNRTIKLERILETTGDNPATMHTETKSRMNEVIRKMLNYWKKQKYIASYKENKKKSGKGTYSYTIKPE